MTRGVEGGSWDRIEETWTIPRYKIYQDALLKDPPVDFLIARFLGYKPPAHLVRDDTGSDTEKMDPIWMMQQLRANGGRMFG